MRIHKVHAVTAKFTAYLHTGMWKKATDGTTIGSAATPAPVTNAVQATTQPVRYVTGSVNLRTGAGSRTGGSRSSAMHTGSSSWHGQGRAGAPGSTSVPANGSAGSPAG